MILDPGISRFLVHAAAFSWTLGLQQKASKHRPEEHPGTWYLSREYYDYGESGATNDVWALGVTLLYTLGMIPFPDTRDNFWTLYKARLKHHPEYATMVAWMENIEEITTTKLDRDDVIQSIVYDMLEKDTMQRVTAATIHKRLDKVAS
jgi:serine/threonine protein kinase